MLFNSIIKNIIKKGALAIALLVTLACPAANIIFDLDGVLITTDKKEAAKQIGVLNIILLGKNPQKAFFNFLNKIEPRKPGCPLACDPYDNPLPQLMCDWMSNDKSPEQILNQINDALAKDQQLSTREKNVIASMAKFLFGDPKSFIKTKKFIKKGLKFVKKCKKNGHKVYILSNWDAPSFKVLAEQHPEFINLFDGTVISGEVGMIKPDPAIYQFLLKEYNLNPSQTVFFDDRPENVTAAQAQGIHGILCKTDKIKKARKSFYDWEKTTAA